MLFCSQVKLTIDLNKREGESMDTPSLLLEWSVSRVSIDSMLFLKQPLV